MLSLSMSKAKVVPDSYNPGVIKAVSKSRRNLAILLRENVHEEIIMDYYLMILSGRSPKIVRDDRATTTLGLKVVPDEDDPMATSPERRDAALRAIMERRDGMPAQKIHLDAEVRSLQATAVIDPAALAALPAGRLHAVVAALRGATAALPPPPDVVDVDLIGTTST